MPDPRAASRIAAAAVAVTGGALAVTAGCGANPAGDFCDSYGSAIHSVIAAAREYSSSPDGFHTTFRSTMEEIGQLRAKAPDDRLRSAFDRSLFTFTVFSNDEDLARFLAQADFSANAVVLTCAEYGVDLSV